MQLWCVCDLYVIRGRKIDKRGRKRGEKLSLGDFLSEFSEEIENDIENPPGLCPDGGGDFTQVRFVQVRLTKLIRVTFASGRTGIEK